MERRAAPGRARTVITRRSGLLVGTATGAQRSQPLKLPLSEKIQETVLTLSDHNRSFYDYNRTANLWSLWAFNREGWERAMFPS